METGLNPVYYTQNDSQRFFRKRSNVTIAFAVGLLLFLLPFAELRCNSMSLIRNSGFGIAIGSEWKTASGSGFGNKFDSPMNETKSETRRELSTGPNIFAIAAMGAGILGFAASFSYRRQRSMVCMSAGILAALMLIALMIQLRMSVGSVISKAMEDRGDKEGFGNIGQYIKLHFTTWYYISLVSFMAAAFFGYKHHRIELDDAIRSSPQFDFQKEENRDTALPV